MHEYVDIPSPVVYDHQDSHQFYKPLHAVSVKLHSRYRGYIGVFVTASSGYLEKRGRSSECGSTRGRNIAIRCTREWWLDLRSGDGGLEVESGLDM